MSKAGTTGVMTALLGAGVVAGLWFFNKQTPYGEHYLIINILALFWAPMMAIFLIAKEDPARFGFDLADSRRAWLPTILLYIGVLLFLVPASRMEMFQSYYPMDRQALISPAAFALSAAKWGLYFFCWEFFFRGFLLFGLQRSLGWGAVLAQALAFGMMHYGKPAPEFIVSFVTGIILGLLALRARSFFPCFMLHWAAAITFDLLVIWARSH